MSSSTFGKYGIVLVAAFACLLWANVAQAQPLPDCNSNGIEDEAEILANPERDCDVSGIPDDCEIPIGGTDLCEDAFDACTYAKFTYVGSLIGAGLDGSSSCDNGEAGGDVWYAYTAYNAGNTTPSANVTIRLWDTSFTGMILSVHAGCPGTVQNEIACTADGQRYPCSPFETNLTFVADPGVTYYIRIAARDGDAAWYSMSMEGPSCQYGVNYIWDLGINQDSRDQNRNGRMDVCEEDCNTNGTPDFQEVQGTGMDACASAVAVCSMESYTGNTVGATGEPDVWFSYTPVVDGNATLCVDSWALGGLTNSTMLMSVHTACPGIPDNAIASGSNRDGCLSFSVTAGEDYFIRLASEAGNDLAYEMWLYGPDCKAPGGRLPTEDCNGNYIPDECDIADGTSMDCNENGRPDECDIADELVSTGRPPITGKTLDLSSIYQLNPLNGDTASLAAGMPQYGFTYGAIAIEPSTGDFLTVDFATFITFSAFNGTTPQAMYRVDRATGAITMLPTQIEGAYVLGMTFGLDGTLYASMIQELGEPEPIDKLGPTYVGAIVTLDPINGGILTTLQTDILSLGMATCPDGTVFSIGLNPTTSEVQALSYDPAFSTTLRTHDLVTGAITNEVELSLPTPSDPYRLVHAIACGRDGTLYGLSSSCFFGYPGGGGGRGQVFRLPVTDIVQIDHTTGFVTRLASSNRVLVGLGGSIVEPSVDCNWNGVPDECETDCNSNGVADECDIRDGTSTDCNENGIPDECDAALALGACPADISVQAADETGIIVNYTAPDATGGCNPLVTVAPVSGSLFPIGTTTVTVTATDQLGATLTCSFSVEVLGPDAPPGPQPTPPAQQFCLPFLFQSLCGLPLCAGPCFFGGMLSSVVGIFGLRVLVRRRFRRRR